ncbi:hypothetical protein LK07_21660 [Streptomyces pluripotens]|uniref:Uncharacterized protein n=1 Tax=Streptomyces pluripotens TaxID=1355015 RepID=A0A221P327_9ACTN|nr:hypothetical protein LK07_21660 [Streptomyces pluripotens]
MRSSFAHGGVEEACATWSSVLDAMEDGIPSGRVRQMVVDMRHLLSPYRKRGVPAEPRSTPVRPLLWPKEVDRHRRMTSNATPVAARGQRAGPAPGQTGRRRVQPDGHTGRPPVLVIRSRGSRAIAAQMPPSRWSRRWAVAGLQSRHPFRAGRAGSGGFTLEEAAHAPRTIRATRLRRP